MSLHEVVKCGDLAGLAASLSAGADIHELDEHGWTPLNWAAGRGEIKAIEMLLNFGADPFRVGKDRRSPYKIALAAGRRAAAEYLMREEEKRGGDSERISSRSGETRPYCKAYLLKDIEQFANWRTLCNDVAKGTEEKTEVAEPSPAGDVVFIHQDLTVTRSVWHGEDVMLSEVTPEWRQFCADVLEMKVPGDFDLMVEK